MFATIREFQALNQATTMLMIDDADQLNAAGIAPNCQIDSNDSPPGNNQQSCSS